MIMAVFTPSHTLEAVERMLFHVEDNQPTTGDTAERIADTVDDHIEEASERIEFHTLEAVDLVLFHMDDSQPTMGDMATRMAEETPDQTLEATDTKESQMEFRKPTNVDQLVRIQLTIVVTMGLMTDEIRFHPT